jgi:hypothetical protein
MSMKSPLLGVWFVVCALAMASTAWSAEPFPPESLPGAAIGANLPAGYETSGIVWHSRLQKLLLVSDGGTVSSMNADGTGVTNWYVGGDLEGMTVARPQSSFAYQEGLTLKGGDLYIGEDYGNGGDVFRYSNFVGVPEPSALVLLGAGAINLLGWVWRRHRR